MSTLNDDGVEIGHHTTHPGWCDPRRCSDTGGYSQHASASIPLTLGGQMYEFALRRLDEHAFPAEPGETRLLIEVTELEFEDAHSRFEIPVQHLDRLIERLTIERNRARFHGSPVARTETVAS